MIKHFFVVSFLCSLILISFTAKAQKSDARNLLELEAEKKTKRRDISNSCGNDINIEDENYYAHGEGSVSNPYRLYNPFQIEDMSKHLAALEAHYILCNDIDFFGFYSLPKHPYFVIGGINHRFKGSLDGNGKTISGFIYNRWGPYFLDPSDGIYVDDELVRDSGEYAGLFGALHYATIKDLTMKASVVMVMNSHVGTLAGWSQGSQITNFNITRKTVTNINQVAGQAAVGGMIGLSWLDEVQDARVEYTNLEGFFSVGGLIGQSDSNLSKVSADTSIRVLNYVWSSNKSRYGGLIGTLSGGQIFNCYSDGTVYADDHFTIKSVGGLIGAIQGSGGAVIEHCHSNAAVKGKHSFGGFVGTIYKSVNISQSYATGKIGGDYNPTGNFAGGFVGAISLSGSNQQVEINTSYATGDVIGVSGGGFIGTVFETGLNSQAIIQDTYSTGDVYAISAGGFLGYSAGSYHIQNSYSAGSVGQYIPYPGIVAFPWFAGFTLDFDSAIHTLENVVTISDVNEVLQFPDALYGVVVAESNSAQPNNFLAYYTEENLCPLNCNLLGTAVGSKSDFYINKLSLPPYNWSFGATQWQANFNSLPTIPSAGAF